MYRDIFFKFVMVYILFNFIDGASKREYVNYSLLYLFKCDITIYDSMNGRLPLVWSLFCC